MLRLVFGLLLLLLGGTGWAAQMSFDRLKVGSVTFSNVQPTSSAKGSMGGQFVEINYTNASGNVEKARLSVNGATGEQATTVAFPPTSGEIKCVTVYVPLHSGANTLTLSSGMLS